MRISAVQNFEGGGIIPEKTEINKQTVSDAELWFALTVLFKDILEIYCKKYYFMIC